MRRPLLVIARFLCLITLLAGCGQASTNRPSPARTPDSSSSAFQRAREAEEAEERDENDQEEQKTVSVDEDEWHLTVQTAEIDTEDIRFVVTNRGSRPHGFGIRQNGERVAFIADLTNIQPGESQTLVATLQPGEYELLDPGTYDQDDRKVTGSDMGMLASFKVV